MTASTHAAILVHIQSNLLTTKLTQWPTNDHMTARGDEKIVFDKISELICASICILSALPGVWKSNQNIRAFPRFIWTGLYGWFPSEWATVALVVTVFDQHD